MAKDNQQIQIGDSDPFQRVVSILEQARSNVVRSVNSNMVVAYWFIGCEIVQERGEFSSQNLHPAGGELLSSADRNPTARDSQHGFSQQFSWSHYRALMRVQDLDARRFYECEAAECGWTKAQLERQIQSSYYERIIANRGTEGLIANDRERLPGEPTPANAILISPASSLGKQGNKESNCIAHIVVHNMVQLLEPTHNDRFRRLMDMFYPKWLHARMQPNQSPLSHTEWS